MNRHFSLWITLILAGLLLSLSAETHQGQRSTIAADTLDAGGGLNASARFQNLGSVGGLGGASVAARATAQHGYPPQVDLGLQLPPLAVARARATCRSIIMRPFAGLIQGDWNTNFITTFDGSNARPDTNVFSHESRPRAGQPGVYEADFVTYNSAGLLWQYGTSIMVLPATDADQNTLLDVMQLDRPGDTPVTGQSLPDWPPTVPAGTVQGQMRRAANSALGAYDLTLQNAYGSVSYSGEFSLVFFECEVSYLRGATNQLHFTRLLRASDRFTNVLSGDCAFTVVTPDQIQLPQFALRNQDGTTYTVRPTTLTRSGRTYRGPMELADGNLQTPWPDFTQWVLELTDDADRDQNGIPDLSDAGEPPLDTDGDGLPDDWELAHQLDPNNPADALLDSDGDGASNLLEYWAGTDPRDPNSVLRLRLEVREGFGYLSFDSRSNRTYRFELRHDLATGNWEPLVSDTAGTGGRIDLIDTNGLQAQRFYRLWVSPNQR